MNHLRVCAALYRFFQCQKLLKNFFFVKLEIKILLSLAFSASRLTPLYHASLNNDKHIR